MTPNSMLTIPNLITLLRFPLILFFFQSDPFWRCFGLILAMISDGLDGYIARRFNMISRFGTFLDPLADKVFVIAVLSIYFTESKIELWQLLSMLSRDFAVMFFGCYLAMKNKFGKYQFRSIWMGKITTTLQLIILLALTLNYFIPPVIYLNFIILGILAFVELYLSRKKLRVEN